MEPLTFQSPKIFYELDFLRDDRDLIRLADRCLEAYQRSQVENLKAQFKPHPKAAHEVSEEALEAILRSGRKIHGIKTEKEISNVLIFSLALMKETPSGDEILEASHALDLAVSERIRNLFRGEGELLINNSGRFWYPAGGYMGWHTNQKAPGWRLYINHAKEPGRSFFRYRDPDSLKIVTSFDQEWNFRLFRISPEKVFWHAVYSETDRFSLGYKIEPKSSPRLSARLFRKAEALLTRVGVFS